MSIDFEQGLSHSNNEDVNSPQQIKTCENADEFREGQRYLLCFQDTRGGERFSHKAIFRGLSEEGRLKFDIIPPGAKRAGSKRSGVGRLSISLAENMLGQSEGGIVAHLIQEPSKRQRRQIMV